MLYLKKAFFNSKLSDFVVKIFQIKFKFLIKESIYGSSHLLSHLTERLSSRRFLHALQNFLLKWVGSDQQWATGFFKLLNIIIALIIKRREILFFINSVNYNKCVLFKLSLRSIKNCFYRKPLERSVFCLARLEEYFLLALLNSYIAI